MTTQTDPGSSQTIMLDGRYNAHVQNTDCQLELWLDGRGCLSGVLTAEDEPLRVSGGAPSTLGEVFGQIHEPNGEMLAVFRLTPWSDDLRLEVDVPSSGDLMKLANPEAIIFHRQ